VRRRGWQARVSGETCPEAFLRRLFQAAIDSASPHRCVPPALPEPPRGRTVVVGAGKAAAAMAQAMESHWVGDVSGLVVTRYGHGAECRRIEVVEAAHPVPDAKGLAAAGRIRELVGGLSKDDLVVCLLSGGGSALLVDPAPGVSLDDKQAVTRAAAQRRRDRRDQLCSQASVAHQGRAAGAGGGAGARRDLGDF